MGKQNKKHYGDEDQKSIRQLLDIETYGESGGTLEDNEFDFLDRLIDNLITMEEAIEDGTDLSRIDDRMIVTEKQAQWLDAIWQKYCGLSTD